MEGWPMKAGGRQIKATFDSFIYLVQADRQATSQLRQVSHLQGCESDPSNYEAIMTLHPIVAGQQHPGSGLLLLRGGVPRHNHCPMAQGALPGAG
jgi:hypothetical protein